jgi:transcriptional regulator with XRE-family HTH domain
MISPEQCRAARAWLGWSQEDLAREARVALSTIRDFENEKREPITNNIEAMEQALVRAGISFESEPLGPSGIKYEGRIKESDTYIAVLTLLSRAPSGFVKTADLIIELEKWFKPKGEDAEILAGRSDTKFSQIVRNIVSHRDSTTNLIGAGWAEYDKPRRGLRITPQGRQHLGAEKKRPKSGP